MTSLAAPKVIRHQPVEPCVKKELHSHDCALRPTPLMLLLIKIREKCVYTIRKMRVYIYHNLSQFQIQIVFRHFQQAIWKTKVSLLS